MTIDNNDNDASAPTFDVINATNTDSNKAADEEIPATAVDEDVAYENEEPTNNDNYNEVRTAATSSENFTIPASTVEPAPTGVRCKLCPHGAFAAFPTIFALMAWLACLSKNGCDYARLTGPIVADITNNPEIPFIDVGFNRYREPIIQDSEWIMDPNLVECEEFNTDIVNIDGVWTFARITSFLSLMLGGSGALFISFSTCFLFKKETWRWAGYEILLAVGLLVLTFSWFATGLCHGNDGQDSCTMSYGAQVDIVACVLWTIAMLIILCFYPAERVDKRRESHPAVPSEPEGEIEMANQQGGYEQGRVGATTDEPEIQVPEII